MIRHLLVSDIFAPARRFGAFVVVFGGFLAGPMVLSAQDGDTRVDLDRQLAMTAPLPPAVISSRINQVWRTETALRGGDVQVAEASR